MEEMARSSGLIMEAGEALWSAMVDIAPILVILMVFQIGVLRKKPPNLGRIAMGFGYVILGMTLFLEGLDMALFPIGEAMAKQLTSPAMLGGDGTHWLDYGVVYAFAFLIGFATTAAEPSLIAVAIKAQDISGGAIRAVGLRMAVALGVAIGVSLGCVRIVSGLSLVWFIVVGYIIVIIQTFRANKYIVPLAYDSGGVTTSTVTVPIVTALGLGLATQVPGRSPLIDGFGLIAFASVFPIMSVMGYAMLTDWLAKRAKKSDTEDGDDDDTKPDEKSEVQSA